MQSRWLLLLTMLSLLTLDGCAEPSPPRRQQAMTVEAQVLYHGIYCGGDASRPSADWITNPQELRRFYQRLAMQETQRLDLPRVDFPQERALVIAMGQRPTGGYRLALRSQAVEVETGALKVPVNWIEPAPGYAQIQVITNPCLLLKLPAIPLQRILVVDQQGQVQIDTQAIR